MLVICNYFSISILSIGRLLGPTDLLSFNDEIKLFHINQFVLGTKSFRWHAEEIHRIIYSKI